MTDQPYLLDNAWREGRERLDAVEALLDPGSIALLDRIGIERGCRCLELGAGGGSIAKWLSARVGATGQVVATDLDTRHLVGLAELRNIEVRRHDIASESLDDPSFDLVHARLVLEHLPERDAVLRKLVRGLKPGGWLLVESVDYVSAVAVSELGAEEHTHSQSVRLQTFATVGNRCEFRPPTAALTARSRSLRHWQRGESFCHGRGFAWGALVRIVDAPIAWTTREVRRPIERGDRSYARIVCKPRMGCVLTDHHGVLGQDEKGLSAGAEAHRSSDYTRPGPTSEPYSFQPSAGAMSPFGPYRRVLNVRNSVANGAIADMGAGPGPDYSARGEEYQLQFLAL